MRGGGQRGLPVVEPWRESGAEPLTTGLRETGRVYVRAEPAVLGFTFTVDSDRRSGLHCVQMLEV